MTFKAPMHVNSPTSIVTQGLRELRSDGSVSKGLQLQFLHAEPGLQASDWLTYSARSPEALPCNSRVWLGPRA